MIRYGSVCSGIEAATVAWHDLGWKLSFFSEIEDFPRAVLQHHYPDVPLHGDFTTIGENDYEPIDLLVGGTPCQAFSVAGLRKGTDDARGQLTFEFVKLAQRLRPRWIVWENVPGVLSIEQGRAFGSFLGGLAELGYGFAYRILDAQYFGVPQRRRRVFVVGYIGDFRRAGAVLFEQESLSGHIKKSRSKREKASLYTQSGFWGYSNGIGTLRAKGGDLGGGSETLCVQLASGRSTTGTLNASQGKKQFIANQEAFSGDFHVVHGAQDPCVSDRAFCLGRNNGSENVICYGIQGNIIDRGKKSGGNGLGMANQICGTLTTGDKHAVCYADVGATLTTGFGSRGLDQEQIWNGNGVINHGKVRRLTPLECERLQGFPDYYTKVPYKGKKNDKCPDAPMYKSLGNSMAVPVMRWLGERISLVEELLLTRGVA